MAVHAAVDQLVAGVEDGLFDRASLDELGTLAVGLVGAAERLEALTARALGGFDARGGHLADGAHSSGNWLAGRTGGARRACAGAGRRARRLREMPESAVAWAAGEITGSHVAVLARALTPRTREVFARDEAMLVGHARRLDADQLAVVVRAWLLHADPDGPEPTDRPDTCTLSSSGGRVSGRFDLGGDAAVRLQAILEETCQQLLRRDRALREVDPTDPLLDQGTAQRRARALAEIFERAAGAPANPARRQPLYTVHTTVDTLTGTASPEDWMAALEHDWHSVIPHGTLDLEGCDAHIARLVVGADGEILDLGRTQRLASPAQRRALAGRDQGCAVPGCDRPPDWCDAHHITHWTHGGSTDLDNLALVCRHHHRRIHHGHLHIRMHHGRPHVTHPDGTPLHPPRTADTRRRRPPPPGTAPPRRAA